MEFIKRILKKKWVLALIGLAVIGGGYYGYKALNAKDAAPQYVLGTVEKGTLTVSVSGTGQVSSSNQVDIKPENSAKVISVSAKSGQEVNEDTIIAQLDSRDASKDVRDAKSNLEAAQIALEKLQKPTDALEKLQAENALTSAQQSKENAEDDLKKTYEDGYNTISDAFLDLPEIMNGLNDILGHSYLSENTLKSLYPRKARDYRDDAQSSYYDAKNQLDDVMDKFKLTSRESDEATIESLILDTYEATKTISDTVKKTNLLVDYVEGQADDQHPPSQLAADQSSLNSYTSETNSNVSALLSIKNDIKTSKDSAENANRTITEKTQSLIDLESGTDQLDIKSQQLKVRQAENALADAQETLGDYTVRSPIAGVLASVDIQKGNQASPTTAAATVITKQKLAELSLNEVDIVKVKVGQKATLTFDAIEDLSISGSVVEIDTLGTTEQGVVSYKVKIGLDTQDERIKPGMSVSASIITDVKQDVLLVPSSAVKSDSSGSYVEVLVDGKPQAKTIIAGASNDTDTEVSGDINAGDQIITQTIEPTSSTQSPTQRTGGTGLPGLGGGGNATFRAAGGAGAGGGFPR